MDKLLRDPGATPGPIRGVDSDLSARVSEWVGYHYPSVVDEIVTDEIMAALESVAAELRREADAEPESPRASGLRRAATVLTDTAAGLRAGQSTTGANRAGRGR